jgi:NAD+ synthase (glutamine-hydrolysing)
MPDMNFRSLYAHGFARVAACTVPVRLADPTANAAAILETARSCDHEGVALAVFPELGLSGYSIEDLLLQDTLLDAVERAVEMLRDASAALSPVLVVGAPLRHAGRVYNTALVLHRGRLLGVVPKSYLPTYREFYERRQVAAGDELRGEITLAGSIVPIGRDLLFAATDVRGFILHVEICEDMWVPIPPSAEGALAGATILANLSGSPITIGRADTRRLLCQSASARCLAAYIYAAAGPGESTTDVAWDGQVMVFENGTRLAEADRFPAGAQMAMADIDLDLLRQERMRAGTFDDNRRTHADAAGAFRTIRFELRPSTADLGLIRPIERFPFVPADAARLEQDCYEAYNIQVAGLVQRLRAAKIERVVIGISGGLDSTHALIVAARALDVLGLPRTNILAFTLPGFATSDHTKGNAWKLMQAIGATSRELDIRPAARQMLGDLHHPYAEGQAVYDITFENVQAGLRTDYLFRLANHNDAIVLGTGDLSELALGWCTYGVGDQMSHYNVNAGVPKTLIQHLIRWVVTSKQFGAEVGETLTAILATEISPELVPAAEGEQPQSTEAKIGPYALQDFNLFYTLRYGFRPSKIAFLATHAWTDAARGAWPEGFPADRRRAFALTEIRHWLEVFLWRFFAISQFKRSAMPNGPKVSSGGALSPRGDWRAPSDGTATAWIDELNANVPEA